MLGDTRAIFSAKWWTYEKRGREGGRERGRDGGREVRWEGGREGLRKERGRGNITRDIGRQ